MTTAIRVEALSKIYRVNSATSSARASYRTLREDLAGMAGAPWRRIRRLLGKSGVDADHQSQQEFWALRDVSFDVQHGEAMGIVGRNGAGKSTLLKILSRITPPTSGRATIDGRVGSLLEVGTGFHPELTGRENVLMNGSILGMTRFEIQRRFDEIVDFSGVAEFLDTPVKRYSSGMQVRLAFAVAAHLNPEILIVDEVLAVGDAEFQRRCISRMQSLVQSGITLLFVSHNLEMIPALCTRALMIESGRLVAAGSALDIVSRYLRALSEQSQNVSLVEADRVGNGLASFASLQLFGSNDEPQPFVVSGEDLRLVFEIDVREALRDVLMAVNLKTLTGTKIVSAWTGERDLKYDLAPGRHTFECCFRSLGLRPGRPVAIGLWMHNGALLDHIEIARTVDVVQKGDLDVSARPDQGAYLCDFDWSRR
jgi:lipopolysaccharide transport system ATP-binding protein